MRETLKQGTLPKVESSNGEENAANPSRAPRTGVRLMLAILVGLALVALYANLQKVRRDEIERVIVTPVSAVTPAASPAH